jgi:hypothetical protein
LIGNSISVYTHEKLKSAIFAFAGGKYSRADILVEFGVGDSTFRKKMQELRSSIKVDKAEFDRIMMEDSSQIKDAIHAMSYRKRGNQPYLEDTEVHLLEAVAHEANEVGYGKSKKANQTIVNS